MYKRYLYSRNCSGVSRNMQDPELFSRAILDFLFGFFFGLFVRVRLITLRIQIYDVPPYKTYSGVFYISYWIWIGFFGLSSVQTLVYGFYAQTYFE